jgi:opacity protein-like surface antigen
MRSYLLGGACAASLMLALTPLAHAADMEPVPEPAHMGWYVSVFGGASFPRDEHFRLFDTGASSTSYTLDVNFDPDNGFMVGAALGAQFTEWLRGEIEVSGHFHNGGDGEAVLLTSGSPNTTYNVDGDEHALFVLANAWLDLPIGGMFRPYIGGGVGMGRLSVDLDLHSTGGSSYNLVDDSDWGFAFQVGGGVAFDITPNIAVDVGYRFKAINNLDFKTEDGVADLTGFFDDESFSKDYRSHNILVGLRFGF